MDDHLEEGLEAKELSHALILLLKGLSSDSLLGSATAAIATEEQFIAAASEACISFLMPLTIS